MKGVSRWLVALACLAGALSVEARVGAQDADVVSEPPPSELEVALDEPADLELQAVSAGERGHLDVWIDYVGSNARRGRLMSGATLLIAGSIVTAIGVSFYVSTPVTELDKGLGLTFIGLGGVYVGVGIAQLAKRSAGEELLAKWNAAKSGTLTLRELGRFEGELRGYSRLARRAVKVSRWSMFGVGMTGALILGVTPAADLSTDGATISYAVGGIVAGLGFLTFGFSFIKSANVDYWDAYKNGQPPPRAKWTAAPSFSRSYAGLNVVGRF